MLYTILLLLMFQCQMGDHGFYLDRQPETTEVVIAIEASLIELVLEPTWHEQAKETTIVITPLSSREFTDELLDPG